MGGKEKKKSDAPLKDVDLEQAQEQLAIITKRDVDKHHGDVPLLYERTGRMFTLRPREEILSSLSESELGAKKEAERLKVAVAQMQIKFNQEKAVFQQMFTEVAKSAQAQKAEPAFYRPQKETQKVEAPKVEGAGYPVQAE